MKDDKMSLDAANAYSRMIDAISSNVPLSDKEYIGEDGFLHCAMCHAKTQTRITIEWMGIDKLVRCCCKCKSREMDEADRQKKIKDRRDECFRGTDMGGWSFENDDRANEKLSDAMQRYADGFERLDKERIMGKYNGLLLYGPVGTGKTFYAACIANRLIENGYRVKMTNFPTLINEIQATFEKQAIIDNLNRYPLLIIDDLGVERQSEFMLETVYNIIDARIRANHPMIITTNLTAEEIKKPQDVRLARIYERILEKCMPVEIAGINRRRQHVKDNFEDYKNWLGL